MILSVESLDHVFEYDIGVGRSSRNHPVLEGKLFLHVLEDMYLVVPVGHGRKVNVNLSRLKVNMVFSDVIETAFEADQLESLGDVSELLEEANSDLAEVEDLRGLVFVDHGIMHQSWEVQSLYH